MPDNAHSHDTHDESYFASFTDMLVGIIFIFIILLMIVANNYQEATVVEEQTTQALQEARIQVLQAANDKTQNAVYEKQIADLKAQMASLQASASANADAAAKAAQLQAELAATADAAAKSSQQASQLQAELNAKADTTPIQTTIPTIPPINPTTDPTSSANSKQAMQNVFSDARAKVLTKIQDTLRQEGFQVTADTQSGTLIIPDELLFNGNQTSISYRGAQGASYLAQALSDYLPCLAPTARKGRLNGCNGIDVTPNNGLDVIFIDDYPRSSTREERLLLAVPRVVSIFDELKKDQPYLDTGLKNIDGQPALNMKVNMRRRTRNESSSQTMGSVVLRIIMRDPTQQDINKLGAGQQ